MDTVGLKELRENLPAYEKKIREGRTYIVMKRSWPIFKIGPVDEEGWETVIDFTTFRKNGISAKDLLARLKKI